MSEALVGFEVGDWRERMEWRRLEMHARAYLRRQSRDGNGDAKKILADQTMLDAFCVECVSKQAAVSTGALADVIAALIQSFIDNPESWIAIIQLIISWFA